MTTTPPPPPPPQGPEPDAAAEDRTGIAEAAQALVQQAVASLGRAGQLSAAGVTEAVEGPGRALARRIAANAVARPKPVGDRAALAQALAERRQSRVIGGTTAAVAARVARRVGPLRFMARRTPMWLVVAAVPALHASVTRGGEELELVASHLVRRARQAGVTPDPERVRRATVQVVSGATVDPAREPRHAPLALAWLQRALMASLPFAGGVATRDPDGLAAAAAAVDPSSLGGPAPPELTGR